MLYTIRCPHCGNIIRSGHGDPIARIGSPIRACLRCRKCYIDSNMYEWAVLDTFSKVRFCLFKNNRWFPFCIILLLLLYNKLLALLCCLLWVDICFLWVNLTKREEISESKRRCSNTKYVQQLVDAGYSISQKYQR